MRLVRCGLLVLVLGVGVELYVPLGGEASTFRWHDFSITLPLTALIARIGLGLVGGMALDERRRVVEWWEMTEEFLHGIRDVLNSLQLSPRIELPIGSTRAGDLS